MLSVLLVLDPLEHLIIQSNIDHLFNVSLFYKFIKKKHPERHEFIISINPSNSPLHWLKLKNKTKNYKPCIHNWGLICIDDVGDEWQDRISSDFDRLVEFASTELTKSGRSIEDGAASTSPDSGINQSSDGRTFLSSSSSSSQLDAPTNILGNVVPIMKSSPVEPLESPPLSELPRTPSPSSSSSSMLYSAQSPIMMESKHHIVENVPKIPLKYQRQLKSQLQKHYKKKFRERTWEYDEFEKDNTTDDAGLERRQNGGHNDVDYLMATSTTTTLHKSSKFRPKGKDWDWRSDQTNYSNWPANALSRSFW